MFPSSDYLSFSQISEKSHYVVKTNFFILSQLTIFSPIYLSYDMKHHYAKLKTFIILFRRSWNKGFFSFSDEHCAPPIGVKYPLLLFKVVVWSPDKWAVKITSPAYSPDIFGLGCSTRSVHFMAHVFTFGLIEFNYFYLKVPQQKDFCSVWYLTWPNFHM